MYIQEAVKKSLESGKWIRRKSFREVFHEDIRLLPKDIPHKCCIVAVFGAGEKEKDRTQNWNPRANDLVADDWEIVET